MTGKRIIMVVGVLAAVFILTALAFGWYVIQPAQTVNAAPVLTGTLQDDVGLAADQRYHAIHTGDVGLACGVCHAEKLNVRTEPFFHQDVSPKSLGPVDRMTCLGCHRTGPGPALYDLGR